MFLVGLRKFEMINFCNKLSKCGKYNVKWHANEMLGHETETLDLLSETRPRPRLRPPLNLPRLRRYKNRTRDSLETETSRPRLRPCEFLCMWHCVVFV